MRLALLAVVVCWPGWAAGAQAHPRAAREAATAAARSGSGAVAARAAAPDANARADTATDSIATAETASAAAARADVPNGEAPAADPPAVDPPAADAPATDASAADASAADAPATDAPATDAPATDAPAADAPAADAPAADAPAADAPAADSKAPAAGVAPASASLTSHAADLGAGRLLRPGRGLLTHDEHRFGQRWNLPVGILLRPFMDLVAIPSGVVAWDGGDWATFAATVAVVGGLSLPLGPQPDVALQRALQRALGGEDHFKFWTKYGDFTIWFAMYATLASMFLYGLIEDAPEYVEAPALAIEAFLVAQAYHWLLKMLTGRDGPDRNPVPGELTSDGLYRGPAGFKDPWGSGTPSGHVASIYAVASVMMHYFDTPGVWIGLNLAAALFTFTVVADNYHFLSEVILGAVMGFCVGRWVVEHRSTRYRNDDGGLPRRIWNTVRDRTTVAPVLMPGGAMGASFVVRLD